MYTRQLISSLVAMPSTVPEEPQLLPLALTPGPRAGSCVQLGAERGRATSPGSGSQGLAPPFLQLSLLAAFPGAACCSLAAPAEREEPRA